jgi:hypothetical protein
MGTLRETSDCEIRSDVRQSQSWLMRSLLSSAVSDQLFNVAVQNGNHMVASSPVSALSTQHSYP